MAELGRNSNSYDNNAHCVYCLFDDAESMLIDQDIVPRHRPHRASVLQPVFKRLLPEDIVCLKASDDLIVVIPAVTNTTEKDVLLVFRKHYWLFQRIIDTSNRRMSPDNRDWYVEQVIASDHEFRRDGLTFVEYAVRVRNYAALCGT